MIVLIFLNYFIFIFHHEQFRIFVRKCCEWQKKITFGLKFVVDECILFECDFCRRENLNAPFQTAFSAQNEGNGKNERERERERERKSYKVYVHMVII